MLNKRRSKVTSILENLAKKRGYNFVLSEHNPDDGYISNADGVRHFFSYGTIGVNNLAAILYAQDKQLSERVLSDSGIKIPQTFFIHNSAGSHREIDRLFSKINFPVIIKPVDGAQGNNIYKLDEAGDAKNNGVSQFMSRSKIILQEYVDMPYEIRIVSFDKKGVYKDDENVDLLNIKKKYLSKRKIITINNPDLGKIVIKCKKLCPEEIFCYFKQGDNWVKERY